jgi:hypothetical protein
MFTSDGMYGFCARRDHRYSIVHDPRHALAASHSHPLRCAYLSTQEKILIELVTKPSVIDQVSEIW